MDEKIRQYPGEKATVTWNERRCIHAGECVRGLPAVFDTSQRPWVQPDQAPVEELAAVVARCPTGALKLDRADGAEAPAPERNTVRVAAGGPLLCHGEVLVTSPEGDLVQEETRIALCRCGASKNKPYCDNSHKEAGFKDPGLWRGDVPEEEPGRGPLRLHLVPDGPVVGEGPLTLQTAAGETRFVGEKVALCRCGASANKPYCDGSHKAAGFTSD